MRNDDSQNLPDEANLPGDAQAATAVPECSASSPAAAPRVREYEAPRDEVEAGVAEILAGFLTVERVGIHDNLILLGGESLLAAQVAWRIRDRFGCEVTLRSILTGTVAEIAAEISEAQKEAQAQ